MRRVLGPDSPSTLRALTNVAIKLRSSGVPGDIEKCISVFKEALLGRQRVLGETHPLTNSTANRMSETLCTLGVDLNDHQPPCLIKQMKLYLKSTGLC